MVTVVKKRMFLLMAFILVFSYSNLIAFGEINEEKSYTVGFNIDGYPLEYLDKDGEVTGVLADVLIAIAKNDENLEFEFVPIEKETSQEIIEGLDLIAFFSDVVDYELKSFSENKKSSTYYDVPLSLIGIKNFSDDVDMKIGIYNYYYLDENEIYSIIPNAELTYYDNVENMQEDLFDGKINFILSSIVTSRSILTLDLDNEIQSYPVYVNVPMQLLISDKLTEKEEKNINNAILNIDKKDLNNAIIINSYDITTEKSFLNDNNLYNKNDVTKKIVITTIIVLLIVAFLVRIYRYNLERIMYYDSDTDLYSEYKFNIELKKILANAIPNEYILVSADIDNFKYINEMYDFNIGTTVLKRFARNLGLYYPKATLVSRTHADNFLILIKNNFFQEQDSNIKLETYEDLLSDSYNLYFSQGIYVINNPEELPTTIIDNANFARNSGKSTYGNTAVMFTDKMYKFRFTQNKILSNMERALEEKEFEVFYQPKIHLAKKKVCGAEALVRWCTNEGTMIFPDEFIPLFEKNRYITKLDLYVFEETCIFIKNNMEKLDDVVISFNLSTVTLLIDDIDIKLMNILKKYNVDIKYVEAEITESAFIDNLDIVIKQVSKLKKAGFTIALDDFGSGISSLNQLKNIEIDVLKIDKAFLSDSLEESKGIVVIKNIINLANDLKLKTVAEGVETMENVLQLRELGCDIAQGYYYAKPLKATHFKEFLDVKEFD